MLEFMTAVILDMKSFSRSTLTDLFLTRKLLLKEQFRASGLFGIFIGFSNKYGKLITRFIRLSPP